MATPNLAGQSQNLKTLLSRSAEPIFLVNANRRIIFFNPACERLTGLSAEAMRKTRCRPLTGPAEGAGGPAGVAASLSPPPEVFAGQPAAIVSLVSGGAAERPPVRIGFYPCHDDRGELLCILGMVLPLDGPAPLPELPQHQLHADLVRLRADLARTYGIDRVVAQSLPMRRVLEQVRVAGRGRTNVLIRGEPGTGRKHLARTIHFLGSDRSTALAPLDCLSLPPAVVERELFGPEVPIQVSLFDLAEDLIRGSRGGSLLLDEVLNLPLDLQYRLVERLTASDAAERPRVLATTSGDPDQAVRQGRLRPDLYYALTPIRIDLPPLRERRADIPLLAQWLIEQHNGLFDVPLSGLTPQAIEALLAYDWPGNILELDHVLARAHQQCAGPEIGPGDLPAVIRGSLGAAYPPPRPEPAAQSLDALLLEAEQRFIEQALRRARGNKRRAADILGISRTRLYRRMEALGLGDREG